mmetsp:Transcript_5451/g.19677  ORF Transcript_5451/g.19677 Transcript_5451/m.19677 type:complete len:304 (-) Transcript_5451:19-930(-)
MRRGYLLPKLPAPRALVPVLSRQVLVLPAQLVRKPRLHLQLSPRKAQLLPQVLHLRGLGLHLRGLGLQLLSQGPPLLAAGPARALAPRHEVSDLGLVVVPLPVLPDLGGLLNPVNLLLVGGNHGLQLRRPLGQLGAQGLDLRSLELQCLLRLLGLASPGAALGLELGVHPPQILALLRLQLELSLEVRRPPAAPLLGRPFQVRKVGLQLLALGPGLGVFAANEGLVPLQNLQAVQLGLNQVLGDYPEVAEVVWGHPAPAVRLERAYRQQELVERGDVRVGQPGYHVHLPGVEEPLHSRPPRRP